MVGDHTYVESATWTAAGLPDTWVLGDGGDIVRHWDYDPATLRLDSIRAGTTQLSGTWNLVDLAYTWEDSGNVGSITDGLNDSQVQCFSYDTANRLVGAFTGDDCSGYDSGVGDGPYTYSYTYTGVHNLATFEGAAYTYGTGNTPATGDAGPHAVVSVDSGAITFGYDNNGNRVSRVEGGDDTSYDYDVENRLVTVTLDDLSTVTMGYDASGARVWRAHGTDRTRYIAGMVEQDLDTGTTSGYRSLYGFGGTPVAVVDHTAATVVYPVGDHLGSIVAAYNDTTNTLATMRYDPWGAERTGSGVLPTDHRFTGQTSDTTTSASGGTGLLFYNARHYDPTLGAFAQADTIIPNPATPASYNRYAYVTNNPVNHTDPSGQVPLRPACLEDGSHCSGPGATSGLRLHSWASERLSGVGAGLNAKLPPEFWDAVGNVIVGAVVLFAAGVVCVGANAVVACYVVVGGAVGGPANLALDLTMGEIVDAKGALASFEEGALVGAVTAWAGGPAAVAAGSSRGTVGKLAVVLAARNPAVRKLVAEMAWKLGSYWAVEAAVKRLLRTAAEWVKEDGS